MLLLDPEPSSIVDVLTKGVIEAHDRAIIQAPWEKLPQIADHPDIFKAGTIPHHAIFPRCAAVVHHGGAGTTHSTTFSGCPSIVIHHFLDQGFWGKELKKAGLALSVLNRRTVTVKKLSKAIRLIQNRPDMKKYAEEIGRIMRDEKGVKTAVATINERFC
jgi:sterol 3beta-glucosyltransferase